VIDLHCHVLPGIDDGPATIEGSLALARAAAAAGTQVLVATPHVNWRYRNDAATIAPLVDALNARLAAEGVVTLDGSAAELEPAELSRLGLGGGPWLLVEPPFSPVAPNLDGILLGLVRDGHRVVLAHPERCPAFQREPRMLGRLVSDGVLTSITAGSLGGRFGSEARRLALALADEGLLHNVASDAHDESGRPPEIAAELERAGLGSLGQWLTLEVPAAILAGGDPPPRPAAVPASGKSASRWWRR
jgi:protein-tyrosine phosphatase